MTGSVYFTKFTTDYDSDKQKKLNSILLKMKKQEKVKESKIKKLL